MPLVSFFSKFVVRIPRIRHLKEEGLAPIDVIGTCLGPEMIARILTFLLGWMLFLLPSLRGMSVTYSNYAIQAGQMSCGRYEYHSEPVFLLLMAVATYVAELLQLGGCDAVGVGPLLSAPIMLSVIGCMAMAYVIRSMGVYALMFIAYIVLDGASSMMPFHLLRQFLSFVVFASVFHLVINDRLDEGALLGAALLAALIHFSGWMLVLLTAVSFFVAQWFEPGSRRWAWLVHMRGNLFLIAGMASIALLAWAFAFLPEYVSSKMEGRITFSFSAIVHNIGAGSGLVTFPKQIFLLGGLCFLSMHSKSLFLSAFYFACVGAWFVVLALGVDSATFNRVQIMILPLAYLAFLNALSSNRLPVSAELYNALFLTLLVGAYFFDAKPL